MSAPSSPRLDAIEALLFDLIPRLSPAPNPRGRPEILPGALLWTRGAGLPAAPHCQPASALAPPAPSRVVGLSAGAGDRRSGPHPVGAGRPSDDADVVCRGHRRSSRPTARPAALATFATGVYAIDESTLDGIARTLPALRAVPDGDDRLLPGKLITAFDVRTQQFATVLTTDVPRQNERVAARDLVATLPTGSLILADLGYFGFRWFDDLTDDGYYFLSKLRQKTSTSVVHVLSAAGPIRDELVWLGARQADRAKHLVRRIQVPVGRTIQTYLTNVLDPAVLPIAEAVRLYARRWDIELAFKTIKRDLGLHLLWSARWELILTQVWGVLLIAQIASALRAQVAQRAGIDLFDVSLTLLLRDLPRMLGDGKRDILAQLAALPVVKGGYLRPSRRAHPPLPDPLPITPPPPDLVRIRPPRYAGRKCGHDGTDRPPS